MYGVPVPDSLPRVCQRAIAAVAARASGNPLERTLRITVNFQPDRRVDGVWLLERIANDGLYRSQFETGYSSGAVPIDPTCPERHQFEHDNFGGAYDNTLPEHRPKYGALDFLDDGFGGAPWYGSAHVRLRGQVLDRTTFCYPDSAAPGKRFGTVDACALIHGARADLRSGADPIKIYVEAHIHGPLTVGDIEAIVLDPSFRDTAVEAQAHRIGAPVRWHAGFVVKTSAIQAHHDFRGQAVADFACSLAHNGVLTPACLTSAAEHGTDPRALRRVWHYLARFGAGSRS
jgi:hypothetical protein